MNRKQAIKALSKLREEASSLIYALDDETVDAQKEEGQIIVVMDAWDDVARFLEK